MSAVIASVLLVIASHLYGLRARDVAAVVAVGALVALGLTLSRRRPHPRVHLAMVGQVAVLTQLGLTAIHVGARLGATDGNQVGLWIAGGLVVTASIGATRPQWGSARWFPLFLTGAVTAFVGVWVALNSGATIDVLVFQEEGAARLVSGVDPYLPGYPNIYDPVDSARFYGPGLARDDVLAFGFPYPPLSLLVSTAGAVVGDVRVVHVATIGLTTWLLATSTPGRRHGLIAAALFATNPLVVEVAVFGWTEPFVALALSTWVWLRGRSSALADVVLGLLVALKQYAVLVAGTVVITEMARGVGWPARRLGRVVAVAAAVTVPLALWHPSAFLESVVGLHLQQPFRPDSLSLLAVAHDHLAWPPSGLMSPILVVATVGAMAWVAAAARRRSEWGDAHSVWAASLVMLVFFLVAKQSFANYYFLVSTMMVVGVAALPGGDDRGAAVTPARP